MTAEFIARMERILWLYRLPYNRKRPVLCYDERPCFLIGEIVQAIPIKEGLIAKEHYSYEKLGSCSLLATIEPLTGKRMADVFDQRRKVEFALHFQKIAGNYPEAEKIIVIPDNLNTPNASSFYEAFEAEEAFRLSQKARVCLYAEVGALAEYDRNRIFGNFSVGFRAPHTEQRKVDKRSHGNCQRTERKGNQNQLAVFNRNGA